jgi:hypothetical protein
MAKKPTPHESPLEIKVDENGKLHLYAGGELVSGVTNIHIDYDPRNLGSCVTISILTRGVKLGTIIPQVSDPIDAILGIKPPAPPE